MGRSGDGLDAVLSDIECHRWEGGGVYPSAAAMELEPDAIDPRLADC